jgi:hypothetical protein
MQAGQRPTASGGIPRALVLIWLTSVGLGFVLALILIFAIVANLAGADFVLPEALGDVVFWGLPIAAAVSILCRVAVRLLKVR